MTTPEMVRKHELVPVMDGETVCLYDNKVTCISESAPGRSPAFKVTGYLTVSLSLSAEGQRCTSEGVYKVWLKWFKVREYHS